MLKRSSVAALALLFLPSVVAAQSAGAAQSQPPLPSVNERVEVVATRIPESPSEVPAAIEVITGEELRARGVVDLPGALSLAAGVDVAPGGDNGPAGSVPEFYGLREFDAFLLVVDGIPWGGTFNPALTTVNMQDVERIEILRGPAPVTYGATSFVGVVHIVHTPAASTRRYATARVGNYGSGAGAVDVPLPFGDWDSRFSANIEREGFRDERTSFVRGQGAWRARRGDTERGTWLSARFDGVNQAPSSPHVRQGSSLSTLTPLDANYNPDNAYLDDLRFTATGGHVKPAFGGSWSLNASFSHSSRDSFRGFLLDLDQPLAEARGTRARIDENEIYVDTNVNWLTSPRTRVVAGADFMHGNADAEGAVFDYDVLLDGSAAPFVPEPADFDLGIKDRREFAGVYGLLEWTPAARLKVNGGLRLNITFEEREGEEEGGMETPEEKALHEQTNVRPSGSIGAIYTVWQDGPEHLRAFASYRNTFKPAAIDFGIGEEEGGEEGEALLDPETSNSFDGGVKLATAGGRLNVEVSGFVMQIENIVLAQTINGLPNLINGGTQRFQGIETAADVNLPHSLIGRATYSYHDATFRDFVQEFDGVPTQLSGHRLEMSARNLAAFGLLYAPAQGVVGNAEVKYVGSRYMNKRNTALAEGFTTLALGAGYRFDRFEIRIDGRNLSDTRPPVAESELGDSQYYILPARRVDVTARVRF
jgi:outer membrane receptor protein involved in Fe transport